MVTVICEKSGIEFEAATKRTKNHPQIMAWLNEANKDGWYNLAFSTIQETRKTGATTLEQFVADLRKAEEGFKHQRDVEIERKNEDERQRKEARRQRFIMNGVLREHGYRWSDLGFGPDEEIDNSYAGPTPRHDWQLFDQNNHAVTVREAMQTLASQGNNFAKEWLAERN